MNHAEDKLVLVHDDFMQLAESIAPDAPTVKGYIQLSDSEYRV